MKRVLLLGDSIRIGYQEYVRAGLAGKAEVVAPDENCRFAKYTLWGVNLWVNELGRPEIVHWNTGLWDVYHEPPMVEALTLFNEYLDTLKRIINELNRTGAKLIFATTTPVVPGLAGRSNDEIDQYNHAATRLMMRNCIEVNDLNSLIKQDMKGNLDGDGVHLTETGYRRCAGQVIETIKKYL